MKMHTMGSCPRPAQREAGVGTARWGTRHPICPEATLPGRLQGLTATRRWLPFVCLGPPSPVLYFARSCVHSFLQASRNVLRPHEPGPGPSLLRGKNAGWLPSPFCEHPLSSRGPAPTWPRPRCSRPGLTLKQQSPLTSVALARLSRQ